ncbi:MAG: PilZ domain-containing protein [Candidatus Omnitrophica bacterium]|nr:PilZ domain-containing protein [Candidatus Omnitrophota bacterium]
MKKMEERRKYIRLEVPVHLQYIIDGETMRKDVTTKDLSCDGLRFICSNDISSGLNLEMNLMIPDASNPVHVNGKVVWSKRLTLEDGSPYEVGVEFSKIEEDNKNTFLKYLCDLIYDQTKIVDKGKNAKNN